MKRLFAGAIAVGVVASAGGLGHAVSAAEPAYSAEDASSAEAPSPVGDGSTAQVVYALGGARPPGIPWYDYTNRAGAGYFPTAQRTLVDYPAAAPFSWVPQIFAPADWHPDHMSIGEAVRDGTDGLDAEIRNGRDPAAALGLSQGTLVLNTEQARLAGDPTAPPPDQLSFTTIGDPAGYQTFGKSFLATFFEPGSYIPIVDYTMPPVVDSQYDSNRVFAAYDGLADFPDRPENLISLANATVGAAIGHTLAAFTGPEDVPPQNIVTTVNSRGAKTTTYMVPVNGLPLTIPLRVIGMSDGKVDQIDRELQPLVDAGYSRNDNLATATIGLDQAGGMDPLTELNELDPATRATIEDLMAQVQAVLPVDLG